MLPRVIAVLILNDGIFYNSRNFKTYDYLGDPINIIRLLNAKECMEACVLNIGDSKINYELLNDISDEALMPLSYGGNISDFNQMIFQIGWAALAAIFTFSIAMVVWGRNGDGSIDI